MNKAGVRIIAVGDPDQSIYGFTGAQPWLLKALAALPNVQAVRLKLNYRCADQIIAGLKNTVAGSSGVQIARRSQGNDSLLSTWM